MIEWIFVSCLVAKINIGVYCAAKMDARYSRKARYSVLAPALAAIATVIALVTGNYEAFWEDIAMSLTVIALYAAVASRFTKSPWLEPLEPKA